MTMFKVDFQEFILDSNELEREFIFDGLLLESYEVSRLVDKVSDALKGELQKLQPYMDINNIELVGTDYRMSTDFILKVTLTRHNFTYIYEDIPY